VHSSQPPKTIRRALSNPGKAARVLWALAKGHALRWRCALTGRRLVGGRSLRLFGTLSIRGPGVVELGDGVIVEMHVTAFTYSPDATIRVGSHCFLNGTRFGCAQAIDIGRDSILGESHVFDTDFHSTAANRWEASAPVRTRPVRLANNVWIAANAGLLPGTTIGENSVVGFGAVCSGSYPADSIIAGNPARVVKAIPGASEDA
jgi:acetyltransferase-like isoleucine patch superfamily enzyme